MEDSNIPYMGKYPSLVFQGGPFEAIKKAKKSEFAYAIGCSPPALSSSIKSSASAPICWFMT